MLPSRPSIRIGVDDTMVLAPDDSIATSVGEEAIAAAKPTSAPPTQPADWVSSSVSGRSAGTAFGRCRRCRPDRSPAASAPAANSDSPAAAIQAAILSDCSIAHADRRLGRRGEAADAAAEDRHQRNEQHRRARRHMHCAGQQHQALGRPDGEHRDHRRRRAHQAVGARHRFIGHRRDDRLVRAGLGSRAACRRRRGGGIRPRRPRSGQHAPAPAPRGQLAGQQTTQVSPKSRAFRRCRPGCVMGRPRPSGGPPDGCRGGEQADQSGPRLAHLPGDVGENVVLLLDRPQHHRRRGGAKGAGRGNHGRNEAEPKRRRHRRHQHAAGRDHQRLGRPGPEGRVGHRRAAGGKAADALFGGIGKPARHDLLPAPPAAGRAPGSARHPPDGRCRRRHPGRTPPPTTCAGAPSVSAIVIISTGKRAASRHPFLAPNHCTAAAVIQRHCAAWPRIAHRHIAAGRPRPLRGPDARITPGRSAPRRIADRRADLPVLHAQLPPAPKHHRRQRRAQTAGHAGDGADQADQQHRGRRRHERSADHGHDELRRSDHADDRHAGDGADDAAGPLLLVIVHGADRRRQIGRRQRWRQPPSALPLPRPRPRTGPLRASSAAKAPRATKPRVLLMSLCSTSDRTRPTPRPTQPLPIFIAMQAMRWRAIAE